MITGDHSATALAIAHQTGIDASAGVITGRELERMDVAELRKRVAATSIYARVMPEQKLKLIQAFKAAGETVAMTGDGVNDAPALKAAHIGIAMGRRGSDVAREAADLILVEDDFSAIVAALRLGRRIYDNIQNAMSYIVGVHVPTAGMAVLPLIFGWPLVLYPAHVIFLEFVIDPACSIAFEAEPTARNAMQRPPRRRDAKLFNLRNLSSSMLQGLIVLIGVAVLYRSVLAAGAGEGGARAIGFSALAIGNIALILSNRSREMLLWSSLKTQNTALWVVILGAMAGLVAVLTIAPVRDLFRFEPVGAQYQWAFAAAFLPGAAAVIAFELPKWMRLLRTAK